MSDPLFEVFNQTYDARDGGCTMAAAFAAWQDGLAHYDNAVVAVVRVNETNLDVPSAFVDFWNARKNTGEFRGASVSAVLAHWERGQKQGRAAQEANAAKDEGADQAQADDAVERATVVLADAPQPKQKKSGKYRAEK